MSCYSRTAYLDTAHLCVVSVCVCMCALFAKKAQPHRGCHSTAGYRLGSIFKPFFFFASVVHRNRFKLDLKPQTDNYRHSSFCYI